MYFIKNEIAKKISWRENLDLLGWFSDNFLLTHEIDSIFT